MGIPARVVHGFQERVLQRVSGVGMSSGLRTLMPGWKHGCHSGPTRPGREDGGRVTWIDRPQGRSAAKQRALGADSLYLSTLQTDVATVGGWRYDMGTSGDSGSKFEVTLRALSRPRFLPSERAVEHGLWTGGLKRGPDWLLGLVVFAALTG